jgi:hypothetical protein
MKRISVLAILTLAVSSWAQSLGDVARANRERPKQPTAKVVTNEDLKSDDGEKQSGTSGDLEQELDRMRSVFREICSDPKTEHGRKLSDYENQAIADRVKPLRRARRSVRAHPEGIQRSAGSARQRNAS